MRPPRDVRPTIHARSALDAYRHAGIAARTHTRLRWLAAPLERVAAMLPDRGDVLDLGCGHGLLSVHLALTGPDRRVLGVDVAPRKVDHARAAARAAGIEGRVRFDVVERGWRPDTAARFDAVVMCDVLYLMDDDAISETVDWATRAVGEDGRIVVKEVSPLPRWKHAVGAVQELVSVRLVGLTAGDHLNADPLTAVRSTLDRAGWRSSTVPLDRGYPYSHAAVVARRRPGYPRRAAATTWGRIDS